MNVMTREVKGRCRFSYVTHPKLKLVSHTGHSCSFLGLCKGLEVAIGGLKQLDDSPII